MESPGYFIRSAARATFSAYRRVPVRWRLGGGSAALTFLILAVFAVGVGVLSDRQANNEFNDSLTANVADLAQKMVPQIQPLSHGKLACSNSINLADFAGPKEDVQIRVMTLTGVVKCNQLDQYGDAGVTAKDLGMKPKQLASLHLPTFKIPPQTKTPYVDGAYRVEARPATWTYPAIKPSKGRPGRKSYKGHGYVLYARPLAAVTQSTGKVRVWLTAGVLGGAVLALLAGLLVADRAMRPISELTEVAREIERTRNPTLSIPHPSAEDEVAELARTLEGMLSALDDARNESLSALRRQREFVADASHELRTPLTSVLANLELLADELEGEPAESAKSALMATRRMRRLVGDLLLLARADVEREKTLTTVDLADTVTNVAVELGPVNEDHELEISPGSAHLLGLQDDLHRLVLNLVGNAISHTPAGTHIHVTSELDDGYPMLVVEDNGPGIAPDLQARVFERFVRGGGDSGSRGTGLGLAIVSTVAEAHDASVTLTSLPELQGTRFEIRFPLQPFDGNGSVSGHARPDTDAQPDQTSTTTGRTIGRRRNRS